jgi:ATP-dependent DNA helicase RecG
MHGIVGTNYRYDRSYLDKLKGEIENKTTGRLSFIEIYEIKDVKGRVLMLVIPLAPTTKFIKRLLLYVKGVFVWVK